MEATADADPTESGGTQRASSWFTLSATCRGESHAKSGLPNQDATRWIATDNDLVIAAIADGAGSARNSHVGSSLAVENATGACADLLGGASVRVAHGAAFDAFALAVGRAQVAVRERATSDSSAASQYATTLIVAAVAPSWLGACQIGDGFCVVRFDGESDYELLFEPAKGEYVNQTTFLTSKGAVEGRAEFFYRRAPAFVCISSDGMEALAIDRAAKSAHAPFFESLEGSVRACPDVVQGCEELTEFLASRGVARRTDDDRSMCLIVRR